jgi:ubiquinone/menaquinone biosynthesis C-methylase UbiE
MPRSLAANALWWLYGYTYDGLLDFYPYQKLIEEVVDAADVKSHDRVLDLGCGTGNFLNAAKQKTKENLFGVDVSRTMLASAERKLHTEIARGRATLSQNSILQFLEEQPAESFDCVVSVNVFYALSDREKIWQQLLRVLSPKGRIIIATATKTGSTSLIRDQLKKVGLLGSMKAKLLGVFVVDGLIDTFGHTGKFEFPQTEDFRREVQKAGGKMSDPKVVYSGVGILFRVTK